jgi:hypothetical protein
MWWHDIKDLKIWMLSLLKKADSIHKEEVEKNEMIEVLAEAIERVDEKLDIIINDSEKSKQIILAEKTLDKFEDYMKNVDKLNSMINEFKGCVSIARAALSEKKKVTPKRKPKAKKKPISSSV